MTSLKTTDPTVFRNFARRIHRTSAFVLLSFIFFHLINHLAGVAGADVHISVMKSLRTVYRFAPVEALLLMSCLVQITSGLYVAWSARSQKGRVVKLQIISGLYLGLFLVNHVGAVLLGRFSWNVETDFHFAAWGVKNYPAMIFFIPYYGLSIIALFTHVACVHYNKMVKLHVGHTPPYRRVRIQAGSIVIVGVVLAATVITMMMRN